MRKLVGLLAGVFATTGWCATGAPRVANTPICSSCPDLLGQQKVAVGDLGRVSAHAAHALLKGAHRLGQGVQPKKVRQ